MKSEVVQGRDHEKGSERRGAGGDLILEEEMKNKVVRRARRA